MISLMFFSNRFLSLFPDLPFFPGKSYQGLIIFPKHSATLLRTMTFSSSSLIASDQLTQRKNLLKNIVLQTHIHQSEECVRHHIPLSSLNLTDLELLRFKRKFHINASLLEEGMICMTLVSFQSLNLNL